MDAAYLHGKLSAVCPINSCVLGDATNPATWSYVAAANATGSQKQAADNIIANGDVVIAQCDKQTALDAQLQAHGNTVNLIQIGTVSNITGTQLSNFLAQTTNNYRSLRAQINAATTAAQVQAIDVTAGWPNNP